MNIETYAIIEMSKQDKDNFWKGLYEWLKQHFGSYNLIEALTMVVAIVAIWFSNRQFEEMQEFNVKQEETMKQLQEKALEQNQKFFDRTYQQTLEYNALLFEQQSCQHEENVRLSSSFHRAEISLTRTANKEQIGLARDLADKQFGLETEIFNESKDFNKEVRTYENKSYELESRQAYRDSVVSRNSYMPSIKFEMSVRKNDRSLNLLTINNSGSGLAKVTRLLIKEPSTGLEHDITSRDDALAFFQTKINEADLRKRVNFELPNIPFVIKEGNLIQLISLKSKNRGNNYWTDIRKRIKDALGNITFVIDYQDVFADITYQEIFNI